MGAVCYKPKPTTISKEDVLKALTDKHLKESITEPDGYKTFKTDELQTTHLKTFGTLSKQLNVEYEMMTTQLTRVRSQNQLSKNNTAVGQNNQSGFGQLELNILTYYGYKEDIYETLTNMSRKTLFFLKKNYKRIENQASLKHANERIRFLPVKSIEEHSSGVNQLLKISHRELVTASDDCYMKFWQSNSMKVEGSIATETITCIALTGGNQKQKDILVAGCHSGNLLMISVQQRAKKEQINCAHYNLIRVIVTLEALKNKYFVTADVCGIVKVWHSQFKTQQILEIEQEGAISYNSMIEVQDMLPKRSSYEDTALIACALKSQKINLILLIPGQGSYQIIKTLKTEMKPTCLIQLSSKHLAIAVGSLKEDSVIEIHDMNKMKIVSKLSMHKDMIDSMLKIEFANDKAKTNNPYIQWFLSASRDRQIVLWKLIDGKVMKRSHQNMLASNKKASTQQQNVNQVRSIQQLRKNNHQKKQERRQRRNQDDDDLDDQQDDDDAFDEDNQDDEENESPDDSQEEEQKDGQNNQSIKSPRTQKSQSNQKQNDKLLDYYYSFDTGHKDFIRSMVQINGGSTLVTASEDKTIKIFTIAF